MRKAVKVYFEEEDLRFLEGYLRGRYRTLSSFIANAAMSEATKHTKKSRLKEAVGGYVKEEMLELVKQVLPEALKELFPTWGNTYESEK